MSVTIVDVTSGNGYSPRWRAWVSADAMALTLLIVLGAGLRLIPLLVEPSTAAPDEIMQMTEQAHRLVYGTGMIPWEFQLNVRSWLLPGFIAALMEAARLIGDGPDIYLPFISGCFALIATGPVICCFLWCRRLFGFHSAIVGGFVVATMPDLVYFGARALNEVVAGNLLVVAIYVLTSDEDERSWWRIFTAGLLLGLVCVLRVQIAPAVAILGLYCLFQRKFEYRIALVSGGMVLVAGAALLDTITLGAPLASIWRYIIANVSYGVSDFYGVQPWNYYAMAELWVWGAGLAAVFLLAAAFLLMNRGWRHAPLLLLMAELIIAIHSAVSHKELRFIYPAIALISIIVGVGLASLVQRGLGRMRQVSKGRLPAMKAVGATAATVGWAAICLWVWTNPGMAFLRSMNRDSLAVASYVHYLQPMCGVGLWENNIYGWSRSGGYTYIHRTVPIYHFSDRDGFADHAAGFDVLVYSGRLPDGFGFTPDRCFGELCVARRAGTCAAVAATPIKIPRPLATIAGGRPVYDR
jgi:GPI mannosyltransferase 3